MELQHQLIDQCLTNNKSHLDQNLRLLIIIEQPLMFILHHLQRKHPRDSIILDLCDVFFRVVDSAVVPVENYTAETCGQAVYLLGDGFQAFLR